MSRWRMQCLQRWMEMKRGEKYIETFLGYERGPVSKGILEEPGIEPGTSRMSSERTTTAPHCHNPFHGLEVVVSLLVPHTLEQSHLNHSGGSLC